ncbi:cell envelope biogenesis protein TolA [Sphingomonas japonica]|uniref:Outer membrane biosynthesis protein TonB n=1 Tax=Sphingomonas japonica TaxID=511662 RepID=A0ABX0TZM0_9SPHN|nr:cell envelope biogenesis protein TolA [Sphingomonas japonica]NIJ22612.1 outer membrane biosynthesis protein TonB [Sphingomonas japonica]
MDRAEKIGLGLAAAGHIVLFGLLSVGFLATPNPEILKPTPIEVSLVDEIGLEAAAPQSEITPAESMAPELGAPEDAAAPAPEAVSDPDPTPPQPQPEPAPAAAPAPKAAPPPKRPSPPKREVAKAQPKRDAAPKSKAAPAAKKATGKSATAARERPRGSRLGDDFLKGIADRPSESTSTTPQAARVDARALAGIQDAIRRQIQPCADRQVNPGPGANEIVSVLNLRLNRDGTLAGNPRVVRQSGVDGGNERYKQRVVDLGIAAFKGCAPLRLPAEFYSTANGGWSNINYNWQLR